MHRLVLAASLGTAVLGVAAPAFAQFQPPRPRNERPQRGLFGSGTSNLEQSLVLNVSFGGGQDNDLLGQATGAPGPYGPRGVGQYGFGSASLGYSVAKETVQASANVGGTTQYYPDMQDPSTNSFSAGMQASWQAAKRTALSTSNQYAYQPSNLRSFFGLPVDAERPPDSSDSLNYAINGTSFSEWRTSVDVSQTLTQNLTGSVGYTYYVVDYPNQQSGYAAHSILGRLTYQFTKSLSVHGGYLRTSTDYEDDTLDGRYGGGTIDAGVAFGKALSLTRRTSLEFSTGLSGINNYGDTRYFFTGSVALGHEIGRSWTMTVGARRSADFYQTFGEPVISSSANAGVSGLLNRRVQVGAQGGWSSGTVGISGVVPQFDAWTAGGSMRVAVARGAGLSFQYTFFDYVFDDNGAPLPIGTQPEMRNQSVRVSFDWMMPLITVARRANASR
jgi:hypothetical protein